MTTALSILNGVKSWVDIDGLSIRHPLDGDPPISQVFGQTSITGSIHLGVDFVCAYQPLHAVLDGVVVSTYPYGRDMPGLQSDGSPGGYGSTVYLRHEVEGVGTFHSYYAHMSRIDVRYPDVVRRGQVLGISGTTGISSGPHEHFELRPIDGVTRIDPVPFINAIIVPPDPWEEFMATLTEVQQKALVNVANAEIAGDVFYAGSPGKTALIKIMDTYRDLPDAAARERFNRRIVEFVEALGLSVADLNALSSPKYDTLRLHTLDLQEKAQEA